MCPPLCYSMGASYSLECFSKEILLLRSKWKQREKKFKTVYYKHQQISWFVVVVDVVRRETECALLDAEQISLKFTHQNRALVTVVCVYTFVTPSPAGSWWNS